MEYYLATQRNELLPIHSKVGPSQNNYAEWEKNIMQKRVTCHWPYLHKNSRKWKLTSNDRELISGGIKKGCITLEGYGCITGPGDGFMDVCACHHCILQTCAIYYMSIILS